jgi:hypothetical protein
MLGGSKDTSEKTKIILEKIKNATGGGEEADAEVEDPDEEMEQEPEDDDFEGDEDEMAGDYDGGKFTSIFSNLHIVLLTLTQNNTSRTERTRRRMLAMLAETTTKVPSVRS